MTRDIDILGCGFPSGEAEIVRRITAIAAVEVDDGVTFDPSTLKAVPIREEDEYHGLRLSHLQRDARGYPVIATVDRGEGDIDFGSVDEHRKLVLATFD